MFSSLRLARSRSTSSTTSCTGGGEKEATVNGDVDRHGDRPGHIERHVYQVTPQGPPGPQRPKQTHGAPLSGAPKGLSSCPTSPLLSGKPPKTPRSLARRGSSKWGLDKALCPSIGSLRDRATLGSRWDDDIMVDPLRGGGRGGRSSSDVCTCSKVTRLAVTREDGCLGITVRGGAPAALVISSVHPGGPADREGSIRPGDRLLAVDGTNLQLADLSTAHTALRGHKANHQGHHQGHHPGHRAGDSAVAVLTIEYSVCVVGAVVGAQGPLLVELARPPTHQLGLTLRTDRTGSRTAVIVDDIKPASVADRSGALHRGDQILAVDDVRVEGTDLVAGDVALLLAGGGEGGAVLRLEILPAHCLRPASHQQFGGVHQRSPCPSESELSAYNALRSLRSYDNGSLASSAGGSGSAGLVSHTESLSVVLHPEPLSGYGLGVRASGVSRTPTVSALHPDGPAERSGCLQIGDRILAVDDREVDAEQLAMLLDSPGPPLALTVTFSVAESVVPASGVFTVKLAKCRPGLGITITGNKSGEYLYISDIKRGSVAHRSGTLAVGDRLLEIDGLSLSGPSGLGPGGRDLGRALDHAARILHNSGDVVTLKVLKDEVPSELSSNWSGWGSAAGGWVSGWPRSIEYPLECPGPVSPAEYSIEYTVELVRHGGPLGLTIAGSEDPSDSVTISGLTPGGLAEQTGALHVGDRLLAINCESLRGRRLSEAIALFQHSADVVTLKIARGRPGAHLAQRDRIPGDHCRLGGLASSPSAPHPAIPSVDSAVESWDSSPSQRNTSPTGTPCPGGPGVGARVRLTPLPAGPLGPGPPAGPGGGPTPGQPLSRRAGSCPSLDCLLQTETTGNNAEWDGSLEDLDSAAATAAATQSRTVAASSADMADDCVAMPPSSPISPPANFRQGLIQGPWDGHGQGLGHALEAPPWPRPGLRPPPSPSPGVGRLTAAKALNNDWQQRQRQQQQQRDAAVDNLVTSTKLSSFQWTNNNGSLQRQRETDSASNDSSLRNLDDFSELNNNLLRARERSVGGGGAQLHQAGRHFIFNEQLDLEVNRGRASSLLLEESAAEALRPKDLDQSLQNPMELYQVTIYKDSVYEDFGFSVSDGLYERGVFINRIRKGGPADVTGVLQPYDRILQVNEPIYIAIT
ncbi:glutamate receptor-interacting protein 2 isoform X2 [Frankliniella occidentalis]|uniref:Glutamate receptor-interacting protein 2 isoform X2 n=1 Tax=Frankliniella occidentalis TaxID=133901 RepID=A0A9C6X9Q1_FRAOC|nr:glutamate receptor-interacting protein 2 isoform X2 [Frankliniella occidentalis]